MKKKILMTLCFCSALLNAAITDLKTLESNFTQSITNEMNSNITYTGKMYAAKQDNQALWEYNAPIEKKIYYKEGNIVIIEPELEQVIYAKLSKVPNVLELLTGATKNQDGTLSTTFNNVTYTIFLNGDTIEKISYTDEIQNKVVIAFTQQKQNAAIDENIFLLKIPKEYDVLEQ